MQRFFFKKNYFFLKIPLEILSNRYLPESVLISEVGREIKGKKYFLFFIFFTPLSPFEKKLAKLNEVLINGS